MIGKARRLKNYDQLDFELLLQFLVGRKIYVTPGVMAEVTNLAKYVTDFKYEEFITANLEGLKKISEQYIPKNMVLDIDFFPRFGYTDTSIAVAANQMKADVLTDDFPLRGQCKKLGLKTVNLDELRERAQQLI